MCKSKVQRVKQLEVSSVDRVAEKLHVYLVDCPVDPVVRVSVHGYWPNSVENKLSVRVAVRETLHVTQ